MNLAVPLAILFVLLCGLVVKTLNTRHIRKMREAYLDQRASERAKETILTHGLPSYTFEVIKAAERILLKAPQNFKQAAKLGMTLADFGSRRRKS